ncbi:MAG: FtsX-like permease family protein [Bryobacteraceae bacterium]
MPEREGEFGIRAALGASRARVTQQLVAESTALTAAGALSGSVVAYWVAHIASSVAAPALAAQEYTLLDWRVFGFAATLALLLGIAFGALPMLLADRSQFAGPILRAQPGCARSAAGLLRPMLLVGQAALALVLLAGSLTMGHTFLRLLDTDLGFRPDNVVVVSVSLHGTRYQDRHAIGRYYGDVLDRLRNVPGVEAAGGVRHLPLLNEMYMAGRIRLDSGATVEPAVTNAVTPGYFETLGTKILAGRDFPRAGRGAERSVLVNEAFAEQSGLGLAITGRRLTPPGSEASYLIAGVVETTRTAGPAYPGIAKVYWPADEEPPPNLTFVARVRGKAGDSVAPCRDAVRSVDKAVALYNVGTLNDRLDEVLARPRFLTIATLFLGVFALLLAVAGTFGAASQAVAQRTHEFGLRMALGASYWHIRGMLFRGTVGPVAAGIPVGTWMALAAARYSEHVIADASPVRLWSCLAAGGLLLAAALLAAWMGSRRIWSIDPSEAVRRG